MGEDRAEEGVANEDDERRLWEKRVANITTFDAMPCIGATVDDLDIAMFRQLYLPKAVPEDVLREDGRDVELQLQSLGFFDKGTVVRHTPVYCFSVSKLNVFLPGAYIQYVRFGGKDEESEVKSEYKFAGNLWRSLIRLDTFCRYTSIINRRLPVSTLREKRLWTILIATP